MTSITAPTTTSATPITDPRAGGGVQGVIGDLLRAGGNGYEQATKQSSIQADRGSIHPFETVSTATGMLKNATANVKGVNRATSILHTIGGFAMLIMASNASGILRSPGQTGSELAHTVADLIDGKDTASGFTPGWFMQPPAEDEASNPLASALTSAGMR